VFSTAAPSITIRQADPADDGAVLALLQASMGWVPDEEHLSFFRWKHRENPHGASPAWVATVGDTLVGFRTFLRWQFTCGGRTMSAVRAVDTATHPDYQGRGIFSRLTRHALAALQDENVDFVFNTPNERSLPGYLKLGWSEVGSLPAVFRPRSVRAVGKVARARTPAGKWSVPTATGIPAAEAFETSTFDSFESAFTATTGGGTAHSGESSAQTSLTREHLRWRYGYRALDYRIVQGSDRDAADGLAVFRLRRRGPALEAAVCDVLVPSVLPAASRRRLCKHLVRRILRVSGADHAVMLGSPAVSAGTFPVPGRGPTLVWHPIRPGLTRPPAWGLTLGDVELF
jgi:GNAT superfamily N-acetyltransferase